MYQKWRDLTFLHFAAEPDKIQKLVPPELTIDTFPDESGKEMAWIGLVPFRMQGIRFRGSPAIAGLSAFSETNVRTYVHRGGKEPGVWFFSLEAANPVACAWARRFFNLPYFHARMSVNGLKGASIKVYKSARVNNPQVKCSASVKFDHALPTLQPGGFEFFLIERYLLYADSNGELMTGQVHHVPYTIHSASQLVPCEESLLAASGIEAKPFTYVHYSPGVDVEVFSLKEVNN